MLSATHSFNKENATPRPARGKDGTASARKAQRAFGANITNQDKQKGLSARINKSNIKTNKPVSKSALKRSQSSLAASQVL